jgi:hypothetical protein
MGLRVKCIKMEEQSLLLETPLLKILLWEDERSDWVNPIFDEREKCGEFHTLFPMLLAQELKFFQYFWNGARHVLLHRIYIYIYIYIYVEKQSNFRKCSSPEERLAVTLR